MFRAVVIICVNSIDQEDVQTGRVFEEVVRVTHDLSLVCTLFKFLFAVLNPFSRGDSGIIG